MFPINVFLSHLRVVRLVSLAIPNSLPSGGTPARYSSRNYTLAKNTKKKNRTDFTVTNQCKRKRINDSYNFQLLSYNVRTMSQDTHLTIMKEALNDINYDVIGLQESKRWGENLQDVGNFILYTRGTSVASGSIGFIVNKKWKDHILSFEGISDRVAVLKMKINKEIIGIITGYAPTADKNDQIINAFYDDLDKALEIIHLCDLQFIIGDYNAKIGEFNQHDSDVMGKFGFGARNSRGQLLIDFARSNEFFFANTLFKKNKKRRPTWSSAIASNEIDFILFKKSLRHRIINFNVLHKFEYFSDHHPIRATIKFNEKPKFKKYKGTLKLCVTNDDAKNRKIKSI